MKQSITLLTLLTVAMLASAQEKEQQEAPQPKPSNWKTSTTPALKISELLFNNWSKAGNSTFDITSTFFGTYKYTHSRYVWDNIADLAYGFAWQDLDPEGVLFETQRKSNDKIDLTSAITWNAYRGFGASFTGNLKTQFGDGFEYDGVGKEAEETKLKVSGFFAPAYLTTALSFEYKKTDWSVSFSFLTGKTTFVLDDTLIVHGKNYGVIQEKSFDPADPSTYNQINHVYFALGSYIKAQYLKKDILPNLDLYARLEFFYDYNKSDNMNWKSIRNSTYWSTTDGDGGAETSYTGVETTNQAGFDRLKSKSWWQRRAFETDVDFELKVDYRFANHISANLAMNLKYDTDFSGMGRGGHWQLYQMAGLQLFFSWKTPKA